MGENASLGWSNMANRPGKLNRLADCFSMLVSVIGFNRVGVTRLNLFRQSCAATAAVQLPANCVSPTVKKSALNRAVREIRVQRICNHDMSRKPEIKISSTYLTVLKTRRRKTQVNADFS